jgi:hypothetical protein
MVVAGGGRGDERWRWRAKDGPVGGGARCHGPWGKEARERGWERLTRTSSGPDLTPQLTVFDNFFLGPTSSRSDAFCANKSLLTAPVISDAFSYDDSMISYH